MYSRPKMPLKTNVTLLKIKQIRLREKYGKGEIFHEAKQEQANFVNNIISIW